MLLSFAVLMLHNDYIKLQIFYGATKKSYLSQIVHSQNQSILIIIYSVSDKVMERKKMFHQKRNESTETKFKSKYIVLNTN